MNKCIARILTAFIPYAPTRKRIRKYLISKESVLSAFQPLPNDILETLQPPENGNRFVLIKTDGTVVENPKIDGLTVNFTGTGCFVAVYGENTKFGANFSVSNGASIILDNIHNFNGNVRINHKNILKIGKNTCVNGADFAMDMEPNANITIGNNCLIADRARFWSSDGHTILDDEGDVINLPQEIVIGNHVWLGMDCRILKGVKISKNVVVSGPCTLTKSQNKIFEKYPNGCIIVGGYPFRILKENILWDARVPTTYAQLKKEGKI